MAQRAGAYAFEGRLHALRWGDLSEGEGRGWKGERGGGKGRGGRWKGARGRGKGEGMGVEGERGWGLEVEGVGEKWR